MELSLRSSFDAEIGDEGVVVVPGKTFVDIVRLLPDADVSLEHRLEEGMVVLTCGTATYKLHTYNPEDFPQLPDVEGAARPGRPRGAARDRRPASDGRFARRVAPVLTGILVRFEPGKLVMAATDSYRLSVKETEVEGETPDFEAIVPAKALAELGRIAQAGDELVLGVHENNQVVFGTDGVWLTTRRIDGQFPNYKQLLPETFEHELVAAARGAAGGRSPHRGDGAAQLAAAAALRRGRADDLGPYPGRGRGHRVAAGRRSGASRSRSASTRSS